MRRMSFKLTMPQMRARTKTVTRRLGWRFADAGDIVLAVSRVMGFDEESDDPELHVANVEVIGPIQFTNVRRERIDAIADEEVRREGFPGMTRGDFVEMFCHEMKCNPATVVTRIAFDHLVELFPDEQPQPTRTT